MREIWNEVSIAALLFDMLENSTKFQMKKDAAI